MRPKHGGVVERRTKQELTRFQEGTLTRILTKENHLLKRYYEMKKRKFVRLEDDEGRSHATDHRFVERRRNGESSPKGKTLYEKTWRRRRRRRRL